MDTIKEIETEIAQSKDKLETKKRKAKKPGDEKTGQQHHQLKKRDTKIEKDKPNLKIEIETQKKESQTLEPEKQKNNKKFILYKQKL